MQSTIGYPSRMSETKPTAGRPRGRRYSERLLMYATPEDVAHLAQLAEEWDVSQAGALRKLIREEAKRKGIAAADGPTTDDEPKA
jgi:hypothetical protein